LNTITLTDKQFTELKVELAKQLAPEIKQQLESEQHLKTRGYGTWVESKNRALTKLSHLSSFQKHQVVNGISAIVRHTVGVTNVNALRPEHSDIVTDVVETIVDAMMKHSKGL